MTNEDLEAINERQSQVIKVLEMIRKQYEKKFGIIMYANGDFKEIKKEEEA